MNFFLVVFNIAAVLFAVYLAVDALDAGRRQSARVDQSLNRLADVLDKLGTTISSLESTGAAPAAGVTREPPPAPAGASIRPRDVGHDAGFLNSGLMDRSAEDGGVIVSRVQTLPGNLNYLVNNDAGTSAIWSQLNDSLAGRNNNDLVVYEPQMAESWEVSEDGLVYTIRLRKNVLWHPYVDPVTKREVPARPVTARDFLFFWNTLQNPKIPAEALRTYYTLMDRVELVDDHTFKVHWKEPYSMAESFTLGMSPLPEHYYRPDPSWDDDRFAEEFTSSPRNQWVVGNGPYRLVRWDTNYEVLMERNESYYGPRPPIAGIHMRLIPDNSVSLLEFKNGHLDYYGLRPSQWHEETPEPDFLLVTPDIGTAHGDSVEWDGRKRAGDVPEEYRFEKYQYNGSSWSYVGYNLQRPLFQDREVRHALTRLIDRQRILDEVFLGLGTMISGPFVPHSPYYNHEVKPIPFDVAAAREMLAKAGWEDTDRDGILDKDYDGSGVRKPFAFTFVIPSESADTRKAAAIIEQDMIKAGIKADLKPIEWSVYTQLLENREFDVCFLAWQGGIEGDPYQIWHSSGAGVTASSNHVGYASEEADRLIEEGRRTVDKEKRYEIYHRLHEVIAADQPYTFLFAPTALVAQNKRLYNAIVYKGGGMDKLLEWIPAGMQPDR